MDGTLVGFRSHAESTNRASDRTKRLARGLLALGFCHTRGKWSPSSSQAPLGAQERQLEDGFTEHCGCSDARSKKPKPHSCDRNKYPRFVLRNSHQEYKCRNLSTVLSIQECRRCTCWTRLWGLQPLPAELRFRASAAGPLRKRTCFWAGRVLGSWVSSHFFF